MRNKKEIENALVEEYHLLDKIDMENHENFLVINFSHGVIEGLEWVLANPLFKGANNGTIKRAQNKLRNELGFGEKYS